MKYKKQEKTLENFYFNTIKMNSSSRKQNACIRNIAYPQISLTSEEINEFRDAFSIFGNEFNQKTVLWFIILITFFRFIDRGIFYSQNKMKI